MSNPSQLPCQDPQILHLPSTSASRAPYPARSYQGIHRIADRVTEPVPTSGVRGYLPGLGPGVTKLPVPLLYRRAIA